MNGRGRRSTCLLTLLLCGVCSAARVGTAAEAWSIEQLVAAKNDWSKILETPLRVEGRLSSQLKGQIRFLKCDLSFHVSEEQGGSIGNARNVEVTGLMRKDRETGRLYFDVTQLKVRPSDLDEYRNREAALRNPAPAEWYELGKWACERAAFYDDKALLDLGRQGYHRGAMLELRSLPAGDVDGRFALADKAQAFPLSARQVAEWRHQAFRIWWNRAAQTRPLDRTELDRLLQRLGALWPEALKLPERRAPQLEQAYAQDPEATYVAASDADRKLLHRLLWSAVTTQLVIQQAEPDGRNGDAVAQELERRVPEQAALAETYRMRQLTYRQQQVATASRQEAVQLADALRQRQRPDEARATLQRWLNAKEQRLRPDDAPGRVALADDFLALLQDEPHAVALLTAAHKVEPESEDVLARFAKLGYDWKSGQWSKRRPDAPSAPGDPVSAPTGLTPGMTGAALRQLLGAPSAVSAVATAAGVEQFWSYGAANGTRLVVLLTRRPHEADFRVSRYYNR